MDIIKKDRNHIFYNPKNTIIPGAASDEVCFEDGDEQDSTLIEAEK